MVTTGETDASHLTFRDDLTIREETTEEGRFYIVKDPLTGRFYRLREIEGFIARQFDGKTDPETVRQRTQARFGVDLGYETLEYFIRNLRQGELFKTTHPEGKKPKPRAKRVSGTLLYKRVKLFDPSRLLGRLVRRARFFYTGGFALFSAACILAAAWILLTNWGEFTDDLRSMFRSSAIPFIIAVNFLVISLHELAHGLTCRYFGGQVREIGFLLIYFQPALYCNVSDAWLFPEKSRRLLVGLSGPWFELFLWSLAVMAWRVTAPETGIRFLSLIVMGTSGIKTLLNFNPLLKLDGYYLLSDYLGIPNLRRKAFRYVGDSLKRITGQSDAPPAEVSKRERRIFLTYGLIASISSFSVLGLVTLNLGDFLIQYNQPLLLLSAILLLVTRLRRKLRKLFTGAGADEDEFDGAEMSTRAVANAAGKPTTETAVKPGSMTAIEAAFKTATEAAIQTAAKAAVRTLTGAGEPPPTPANVKAKPHVSRSRRRRRRRYAMLAVAGAVTTGALFVPMELRVSGPFTILPVHNADVRTEIEGIVEEIYITEGDTVRTGDRVARLSGRELRTELLKTESLIQQARARLRMQKGGPTPEEVDLAQTTVSKAADKLRFAESRLERNSILYEKNLLARLELENTQEQAAIARNDLAEAEKKLSLVERGARQEEIETTRAEISSLETQKKYVQGQLERVDIRTPAAGIVTTPSRQLREMVGQLVLKGALIAKVFDVEWLTIEIAIPEKEIADVRVGQSVGFKTRAYPDETFYGVVTSIATTAQTSGTASASGITLLPAVSGGERSLLVRTQVDNRSLLLKPGMSGQAKAYCGQRRILDLITRRLARTIQVEFWSWW